ncbi:MAG: hypothetical protein WCP79_00755 [Bacillota bacterium]
MGYPLKILILLIISTLALSACQAANLPDKIFAPYVDMSLSNPAPGDVLAANPLQLNYTLTCVIADPQANPVWSHNRPLDTFLSDVQTLRNNGGKVIISFGGENADAKNDLATKITDISKLVAAYQTVLTMYQPLWLDFDIEDAALQNPTAIERRNRAVAALQTKNPDLAVSFTFAVMPTGLSSYALDVLQNAKDNKVKLALVNLLVMDYGNNYPATNGKLADYSIRAAKTSYAQLQKIFPTNTPRIGLSPCYGQNLTRSEIFDLQNDAPKLLAFAQQTAYVQWLCPWSASRDSMSGDTRANSTGIKQSAYAFMDVFRSFN